MADFTEEPPGAPSFSFPDITVPSFDAGFAAAIGGGIAAPSAITGAALPSGSDLFQTLLDQPLRGGTTPALSDFEQLLQRGPLSEFEQLLSRDFVPGAAYEADLEALAGGLPMSSLLTVGAGLLLAPSSIAPSDAPPVFVGQPGAIGGPIPTSLGNPTIELGNNPPDTTGLPFVSGKPETSHPPAPPPAGLPLFNIGVNQPSVQAQPFPKALPKPLTGFRTGVGPSLPDQTRFLNPTTSAAPKPAPKTERPFDPLGNVQTVSPDCNKGKRKGRCRQGYFREKETGSIQLITWSTRKCPSSSQARPSRPAQATRTSSQDQLSSLLARLS